MRRIVLRRTIAAPSEDVFVFFVPQRMPYWYGREMQSCLEMQSGASDFALGQKVRISGQLGGKTFSHTAVITAFENGRLLEWRFQDSYGVRGKERWELRRTESAAPQTEIHFLCEYEMPGLFARTIDALLTRHALARRNRDYLERLARLAERRA